MAVYTHVTDDELAGLLHEFGLGRLHSCSAIQAGVENSNYRLETEAGHFILTLYEKRVQERDLPFFLGLMSHLGAKGIDCPRPVRNRSGAVIGRVAGRACVIVSVLTGASVDVPTTGHLTMVGRTPARLHAAGPISACAAATPSIWLGWTSSPPSRPRPTRSRRGWPRRSGMNPGISPDTGREDCPRA